MHAWQEYRINLDACTGLVQLRDSLNAAQAQIRTEKGEFFGVHPGDDGQLVVSYKRPENMVERNSRLRAEKGAADERARWAHAKDVSEEEVMRRTAKKLGYQLILMAGKP